jgi:hypothetical protein
MAKPVQLIHTPPNAAITIQLHGYACEKERKIWVECNVAIACLAATKERLNNPRSGRFRVSFLQTWVF